MLSLGIDIGGTSIKLAALRGGALLWTARSAAYDRPDRGELTEALRGAAADRMTERFDAVGLCVPGLLDRSARTVTLSVNVPGLSCSPLDALLADAFAGGTSPPRTPLPPPALLLTDAHSAAHDIYTTRKLTGRLLLLALGTGVGAAVLDPGGPLHVDGESPGHFGQLDVSLDSAPPIGPDGGAGSLEAYIGAAALRQLYGDNFRAKVGSVSVTAPPLLALSRAIRIGHALYRPHHVCLVGGIGIALRPLLTALQEQIGRQLTNIARANWTLTCGDSDFHAARGAAQLAAEA